MFLRSHNHFLSQDDATGTIKQDIHTGHHAWNVTLKADSIRKDEQSQKKKSSRPIDVSTLEHSCPRLSEGQDQQIQIEGPHWSYKIIWDLPHVH